MPSPATEQLIARLHGVRSNQNGWSARCPAHEDHSNSLSIAEGEDGRALLKCFAGCSPETVVAAIGLSMRDLYPPSDHGHASRVNGDGMTLTIEQLASDKRLPSQFLADMGLTDRHDGVLIPYRLMDGSQLVRQRLRTASKAKDGSFWVFGKGPIVPYGLWRREDAAASGYACLVEGESDCWSAWFHKIPALGIPGATMVRRVLPDHVRGIKKLYVVKEPDLGGERFVSGVARRLHEIEWAGEAHVLTLPQGIKDLNDLHRANPDGFEAALAAAIQSSVPLPHSGVSSRSDDKEERSPKGVEPRQTEVLLELADGMELFHDPNKDPFASFQVGEHVETWPIRSRSFRRFLAREFYLIEGRPSNSQTMQAALDVLEARAIFDGPELPTFLRLAEYQGRIYLDLANPAWQAVEITAIGHRVVSEPPVKFRRTRGMQPLPHPLPGGRIDDLRQFLNIGEESDWHLMLSWLLANLRPRGPYPVLVLNGQHGSAKSTVIEVLRSFCDPNTVPLRAEPRDVRDLMIAATNSWCICLDNVSHLKSWLSDALCRLSTGGGFSTRSLFTDADEMLFDAQRPVALNGIEEIATRSDLLDRSLIVTLPEIPDDRRVDEESFTAALEEARPRIFGALLEAVCTGIRMLPTVRLPRSPRMADFARWISAIEPSLSWSPGTFLNSYAGNRENVNQLALEASPVAAAVMQVESFEGIAAELLPLLEGHVGEAVRKQEEWPRSARALSGALRRIAPNLRAAGVEVTFSREKTSRRRRMIAIKRIALPIVQTVHTVQNSHSAGREMDGVDAKPTESGRSDLLGNARETNLLNGLDGVDGRRPGSYDDVG